MTGVRTEMKRAAIALMVLTLGGCSGILSPAGPIGRANVSILLMSVAIMLCIVVPTIVAALAFGWWYRRGNPRAQRRPGFVYSGRIELIVWSIPLLTVLFLGGVAWVGSHQLDPFRPLQSNQKPVEVQVVALDWKWLFIYPDYGVASVNELAIPAGVPVHFTITSASVMNTFFVPQLGSMIYAMNGMATQLNLQADRPGRYRGMSAHFSGDGFADMRFEAVALPPAAFLAWIARVSQQGAMLDRSAYMRLARQSRNVRPFTYRAVQPQLFDAIVTLRVPPAPGPSAGQPNRTVSPRTGS